MTQCCMGSLRDSKEWKHWGWKDFLKKDAFKLREMHDSGKLLPIEELPRNSFI